MKKSILPFLLLLFIFCIHNTNAQDLLVEINNIRPEKVRYSGFELNEDQEIQIKATVFYTESRRNRNVFLTNAWIIESDSRDIVWEMSDYFPKRRRHQEIELDENVKLKKGKYELYYSSFPYYSDVQINGVGDLLHVIFDGIFNRDDWEDEYGRFSINIYGNGKQLSKNDINEYLDKINENAIIALNSLRNDRYEKQGFTLDREMDLRVYAVGEIRDDSSYDYGWIIDADSREKVWKMDYDNTYHAGGAEKNRMADEVITLPAGNYAVIFVTDGSHSYRRWNSPPPYDALFWGITIHAKDPSMTSYTSTYDYEDPPMENVIVELTRMRDDEYQSKGFSLKKDMNVRVYALGEGSDGDMDDYGWIENARTHKKVWKMRYRNTEHAGGASKNRLSDEVIQLDKGNYIVYYTTDGSHSYRDWNSAAPFDRKKWGITLMAMDKNFDPGQVSEYDEDEYAGDVLVKIDQVRDDEYERQRFSLDQDSEIHIYAVGEGSGGSMHDYGWIENAETGKIVWEMTYRKTEHAGGASKNRMFNDTIFLKKGDYTVYYETDGSHSYRDWNSRPPHHPKGWGITLNLVKE